MISKTKIVYPFCLIFLSSCASVGRDVPIISENTLLSDVAKPAICNNSIPSSVQKISPILNTLLKNYANKSTSDEVVRIQLAQCFSEQGAYLDYLADSRINPRPSDAPTFVDPEWRSANYTAWEASVSALRAPVFASLLTDLETRGGKVNAVGVTSQTVITELKLSVLINLLNDRGDIFFAALGSEFPEVP